METGSLEAGLRVQRFMALCPFLEPGHLRRIIQQSTARDGTVIPTFVDSPLP